MKSYSDYLAEIFPAFKVQKISVNAGFSCPNRDGTISFGGCIYCRNDSFSPGYCNPQDSVSSQLEKGKKFFMRKYPHMKYLAYFQTYTNTFSNDLEKLKELYYEALEVKDVVGLVISTRPDCLHVEILELLEKINTFKPVFIEIGAESSNNQTLKLINRNHTWEDVVCATKAISEKGMHCGLHLIAGLPGEPADYILTSVKDSVTLPIETMKIHQLQILYGTKLFDLWQNGDLKVPLFTLENYLELCAQIIKLTPDNIVIERFISQSPTSLVVSPKWNLKNYQFMDKLADYL